MPANTGLPVLPCWRCSAENSAQLAPGDRFARDDFHQRGLGGAREDRRCGGGFGRVASVLHRLDRRRKLRGGDRAGAAGDGQAGLRGLPGRRGLGSERAAGRGGSIGATCQGSLGVK